MLGAHPRSRGENSLVVWRDADAAGSSPLTRGKRLLVGVEAQGRGLIPAHAGKTGRSAGRAPDGWAHPRSRGENLPSSRVKGKPAGSSPLTRGKREA